MSTRSSGKVIYNCGQDHSQTEACSGHTMEVIWHHTSDTVSIVMDGKVVLVLDECAACALRNALLKDATITITTKLI